MFEVEVDGDLIHSKKRVGHFPEFEDVLAELRRR